MNKRDLLAEIEEIRQRQGFGNYPVTIPDRMHKIACVFQSNPGLDLEFVRYVPIGIVACIEGFVRSAIKEIVDAGTPFVENAVRLSQTRDFKADFEVLGAVHGRRVSIGELIARLVSINGLTQIDSVMSTITGRRFLEMLTTVHSRWDVEIEGRPREPIMLRPEVVLRHVHEMFRLRNIYAHELVVFDEPDRAAIGEALESSVAFLKAAAEVVGNLLHPDAPLTQADMNRRSLRDLEALDAEIATILEKLSALVGEKRRDLLHASQQAWLEFRRRQAEFEASIYREGTIYPVIFGTAAQALAKVRLTDLRSLLVDQKEGF